MRPHSSFWSHGVAHVMTVRRAANRTVGLRVNAPPHPGVALQPLTSFQGSNPSRQRDLSPRDDR